MSFWQLTGLAAIAAVAENWSARRSHVVSTAILVVVNLIPLVLVLLGEWAAADLLIAYWIENVAVGFWAVVRIATARGRDLPGAVRMRINDRPVSSTPSRGMLAGFFVVHYGIFTLVHGVFTVVFVTMTTTYGTVTGWALIGLSLLVSHGLSTAVHWFGQGERTRVSPSEAMGQPYGRVIVMHLAIMGTFFLVLRADTDAQLWPAVLLVGLKTVLDIGLHLRQHARAPVPPKPREGPATKW